MEKEAWTCCIVFIVLCDGMHNTGGEKTLLFLACCEFNKLQRPNCQAGYCHLYNNYTMVIGVTTCFPIALDTTPQEIIHVWYYKLGQKICGRDAISPDAGEGLLLFS